MLFEKILPVSKGAAPTYIEDVFSTYLYTGNGTSQTITNGIDLAGKGGMVWTKSRNAANNNLLVNTVAGGNKFLISNGTDSQSTATTNDLITSFGSSSYTLGADTYAAAANVSGQTYASWTFRKAPKFFDVVTYTGDGVDNRAINHSLGVTPGMIIIKQTNASGNNWIVYHRSTGTSNYLILNATSAAQALSVVTATTDTTFSVMSYGVVNGSGSSYVAYLFAHDTTTDGLIQCGSYTGNGSATGPVVNLGWEPQFVLVKLSSGPGSSWQIQDNMRGIPTGGITTLLSPNTSAPEANDFNCVDLLPNGFQIKTTYSDFNDVNKTYIYMAIRRGPMRTPTDGTKVFSPLAVNAATGTQQTTNFPVDMQWAAVRAGNADNTTTSTRLIGVDTNGSMGSNYLVTSSTAAEATGASASRSNTWWNTGFKVPSSYNSTSTSFWNFQRAPGFFDVVCYTGTGAARTVNHNLGVAPELMIVKSRSNGYRWAVYSAALGSSNTSYLNIETNGAAGAFGALSVWNNTNPTSSVFSLGTFTWVNASSETYVAYLFASCPGVSKVGSYTGTGATQTISCGFTGGARFVLIKRTDSTGDWYVWDTARGMVSGTDPFLLLNIFFAEVNANRVYTTTGGFQIVTTAADINASGGTYIYLAIA